LSQAEKYLFCYEDSPEKKELSDGFNRVLKARVDGYTYSMTRRALPVDATDKESILYCPSLEFTVCS